MFALWRTVQEPHEQFFNYIVCDKKISAGATTSDTRWVCERARTPYRSSDVLCRENNNNWISVMYHKFLSFDFSHYFVVSTLCLLYDYLLAAFVRACVLNVCVKSREKNHIGDEKRKKRRRKRDRTATTHMSPSDVSVIAHLFVRVAHRAIS